MKVIVQLARTGDILSILPAAQYLAEQQKSPIDWLVHPIHAPILAGCSYVKPHLYSGDPANMEDAIITARKMFPGADILATQVNGNPTPNTQKNFILDQWSRAGLLELREELPLCFDELPPNEFDYADIVVNLAGISSVLPASLRVMCMEQIERIAQDFGLVTAHVAPTQYDDPLLWYWRLKECKLLITIDSMPLHMAYATRTPTICFQRELEWYQTPPRDHWIGRHEYPDLVHLETWRKIKNEIAGRFDRPEVHQKRSFVHVCDFFVGKDVNQSRRHNFARSTWGNVDDPDYLCILASDEFYTRTSKSIGDTRSVPFLKDVVDFAFRATSRPQDTIIFTNADTCFTSATLPALRDAMALYPAVCCGRYDLIGKVETPLTLQLAQARGQNYPGTDLFAFTAEWWRKHRDEIPDLLIACEGWDFVLWKWIERHGGRKIEPLVYHEYHGAFWSDAANILTNPGQRYNREVCFEWAVKNGYADFLGHDAMLFRSTPQPLMLSAGTIVWSNGSFEKTLRDYVAASPPKRILETGTHIGTGSTSIVLRAMDDHAPKAEFVTMEVNGMYYEDASAFLFKKPVRVLRRLSIPRELLPNMAHIFDSTVALPHGLAIDHAPQERVERYFGETDFPDVKDDGIGEVLAEWGNEVDLVILDSAGHVGWIEFMHLDALVKGKYAIMLDDTLHLKHYRTANHIRGSARWRVVVEGRERNGFMLAERIG